jgi:hypothetical protein
MGVTTSDTELLTTPSVLMRIAALLCDCGLSCVQSHVSNFERRVVHHANGAVGLC